jgi:hypothetical protein
VLTNRSVDQGNLGLRNGEVVEVKSVDEILATLDERGRLEALPFMPEMLAYAGKRLRVSRRALKLCDTIGGTGYHRMYGAVHLEDTRCDGGAHDGCQAGCLLYWKEAWLKRIEPGEEPAVVTPAVAVDEPGGGRPLSTVPPLLATTTRADGQDGGPLYSCQATELDKAAPELLPWWDVRTYIRDVRSGNARLLPMLRSLLVLAFNKFQGASRRFLPPRLRLVKGGQNWPFIAGSLEKTPKELLELQADELVEVKSKEEILATLDRKGCNRGLSFDREMLQYCGRRARVLRRVEHIIDEKTGKMLDFGGDCIILDGVICAGDYNQYCPRHIYPYWREIWLRRVEDPAGAV